MANFAVPSLYLVQFTRPKAAGKMMAMQGWQLAILVDKQAYLVEQFAVVPEPRSVVLNMAALKAFARL